jgi:hypothetical protein
MKYTKSEQNQSISTCCIIKYILSDFAKLGNFSFN